MANRPMFKSNSSFPPPCKSDPPPGPSSRLVMRAHRNSFVSRDDEKQMFEQSAQADGTQAGPLGPEERELTSAVFDR
ncbi:MAG: hypothetical protein WC551_02440 [Patescibacteria group bacterium]